MLTGDHEDPTLATAYSAGLIGKSEDCERINNIQSRGDLIKIIKRYITRETNTIARRDSVTDNLGTEQSP